MYNPPHLHNAIANKHRRADVTFASTILPKDHSDILAFLLSLPDESQAKQFGVGGFPARQTPTGTVKTVAHVKKSWHGRRRDRWIIVRLDFVDAQGCANLSLSR
jgi:hypothetical protein